MPQHIWSKVADPATFTNPNPVGSGPFAKVGRFTTQDYVFNKNPNYWLAGAPKVPCLEYAQAASNDAALLLIQSGQVDWTHNFVPNVATGVLRRRIRRTTTRSMRRRRIRISLMLDTTQYPYSIVAFRKALSLAINRSDVSKLGEYGYAPPTDAIGLNGIFPSWVTGRSMPPPRRRPRTTRPQRRSCSRMPASRTRAARSSIRRATRSSSTST